MKSLLNFLKATVKLAIVVAVGFGAWYGYETYMAEPEEQNELGGLPTVTAEVRDITVSVSATGVLQPIRVVQVKSKASGEILDMTVETGDYLEQGDLIAQIDTEIIDQELKQAEADFESAKVRLDIAEKQYDRAKSLFAQDLLSENDLETSQQNFTNAQGQHLRAEAALELARERREDATVRAPITGRVIAKNVEQGQIIQSSTSNVSGGASLVEMADLSELEIRTLVDEIDIGQVKPGLFVQSTVEAFPEREFEGEVIKIEPQPVVQQSVTTFPVLSRIDNSDGLLLPGMNADVEIIIHRRPRVLAVRNEAVRTPDDAGELADLLGLPRPGEARELLTDAAPAGDGPSPGGTAGGDNGDSGEHADNGDSAPQSPDHPDYVPSAQEIRDLMAELRRQGGGGGRPSAGAGGRRGGFGGGRAGGGGGFDLSDPETRRRIWQRLRERAQQSAGNDDPWGMAGERRERAVVFALDDNGALVSRQIVAGVRDWEYTEVVAGLEPGDELVVLPSVSLLRSQEQMRERFSRFRRGGIPGM